MKSLKFLGLLILFLFYFGIDLSFAQENSKVEIPQDSVINVALELITEIQYCALITLDKSGHPQARTMQPFPPEKDLTIWFGTNNKSRKAEQIKNDSRATVYYADPAGNGYVVLTGNAKLVDDTTEKNKRWMESWEKYYPDRENTYILIRFIPETVEVVSYKHGLVGDKVNWRAPNTRLK